MGASLAVPLACLSAMLRQKPPPGGAIGLVEEDDKIEIDIPSRRIELMVSNEELTQRRAAMDAKGKKAWKPVDRQRSVSVALKSYAMHTTSADRGAVRDLSLFED